MQKHVLDFQVPCYNTKCYEINSITTGKRHGGVWNANSKVQLQAGVRRLRRLTFGDLACSSFDRGSLAGVRRSRRSKKTGVDLAGFLNMADDFRHFVAKGHRMLTIDN